MARYSTANEGPANFLKGSLKSGVVLKKKKKKSTRTGSALEEADHLP